MKKLFFLIPLMFTALKVVGQVTFQDGFITMRNGDSLRVVIDATKVPDCYYKRMDNDTAIFQGAPSEMNSFYIKEGQHFESISLKKTDGSPDTVFMECFLDGLAGLFLYENTYYVKKADTLIYPLQNDSKFVEKTVVDKQVLIDRVYENKNYLRILNYLLHDCPEIRQKINNTRLEARNLVKLLEEYNRCMNYSSTNYLKQTPLKYVNLEINGGVLFSRLNLTQTEKGRNEFLYDGKTYNAVSAQIGGALYFSSPRSKNRLSFAVGLLAYKSKYNVQDSIIATDYDYYYNGTVEFFDLSVPLTVRYTIDNRKIRPFFELSMAPAFLINPSSWMVKTTISSAGIRSDYPYTMFVFPKMLFTFDIGAGLSKPISDHFDGIVKIKYAPHVAIDFDNTVVSRYSGFSVCVGLRFK